MAELYNVWNSFWNKMEEIEKIIEPFAKRSMLTSQEALTLIVIGNYGKLNFIDKNTIDELCKKGLTEYTENGVIATSKGAIIAKSLTGALNKL